MRLLADGKAYKDDLLATRDKDTLPIVEGAVVVAFPLDVVGAWHIAKGEKRGKQWTAIGGEVHVVQLARAAPVAELLWLMVCRA